MADWRQIHARIRKAKTSKDPQAQLNELYERTRDAMVAFELAQWHEKAVAAEEAVRWYTLAAEHFRRAQWRTKAEEALTRLGAPIPVYLLPPPIEAKPAAVAPAHDQEREATEPTQISDQPAEAPDAEGDTSIAGGVAEGAVEGGAAAGPETAEELRTGKKRRRRGRRGGRNRRRGERPGEPRTAATAAPASGAAEGSHGESFAPGGSSSPVPARPVYQQDPEPEPPSVRERAYEPAVPPSWQGRTRAGEPALASRISHLESQLRRLLACPLASLDEADQAPAGPGVLLLSDSDQVTHYYVESCQTLRIAIGNLIRGGRGSKEGGRLKERMADNLGIVEARVSKYLKDHCAVRWIQLDEGAAEMAHFAMAVLRPVANE